MPFHHVLPAPVMAITRTVTVAAGRFAPGHLGELTAVVPFELVDAVLAERVRPWSRFTAAPRANIAKVPRKTVVQLCQPSRAPRVGASSTSPSPMPPRS